MDLIIPTARRRTILVAITIILGPYRLAARLTSPGTILVATMLLVFVILGRF